jgi:hypothetical protein
MADVLPPGAGKPASAAQSNDVEGHSVDYYGNCSGKGHANG